MKEEGAAKERVSTWGGRKARDFWLPKPSEESIQEWGRDLLYEMLLE